MYNINNAGELRQAILLLENEVAEQEHLLTGQISDIYESFRPVNIIKDLFREVVTSEELRSNILTAVMGISTGYISKKIFFGKNTSSLKVIIGTLFQYMIANLFIHPGRLLRTILDPFQKFFTYHQEGKTGENKTS